MVTSSATVTMIATVTVFGFSLQVAGTPLLLDSQQPMLAMVMATVAVIVKE